MMHMNPGYTHGWFACRRCFMGDEDPFVFNNWELHNDPGYAGSSSPRILVLGFSKGATQTEIARQGDYDKVPFAGMRPRLQQVLERLGLMPQDRSIDAMLTAKEKEFGGTSLVRCSLCRKRKKDNKCVTSGAMVTAGFRVPEIHAIIRQCVITYLANPPDSIKLVILLGTNRVYIQKTGQLFQELYPDYKKINDVAFQARGALWLYAAHPSPANANFKTWIDAEDGNSSGRKCLLALEALAA